MDPMWVFNHDHQYNNYQESPNERQQKANKLYFTDKKYDTLLLGSSRTTYMNQENWKNYNAFNFSVGDLLSDEYSTLIDFAINDSNQPIKTVIIGADFFGYFLVAGKNKLETKNALNTSKSNNYRYKLLLSADTTRLSLKNIRNYFMSSKHVNVYSRSNIKHLSKRSNHTQRLPLMIKDDLRAFGTLKKEQSNEDYFVKTLSQLKKKYPKVKFIVFTTPVSLPLFNQIIKNGLYTTYESWLKDLVSIFGEVHHFMYKSHLSINYSEYFDDSHHTFSSTQDILVDAINKNNNDLDIILNKDNIDRKLTFLRVKNIDTSP